MIHRAMPIFSLFLEFLYQRIEGKECAVAYLLPFICLVREKVQDIRTVVGELVVLTVDCFSVAGISLDGDSISV